MKQNAVGLANICILSTMVLVTVSTTVSLYGGVSDILEHRYPYDLEAHFYNAAEPVKGYARSVLEQAAQEAGLEIEAMVDYESLTMSLVQDGNALSAELSTDLPGAYVQFLTVEGWEALTGQQLQPLGDHQVALCVQEGNLGDQINLLGEDYTVTQRIQEAPKDGSLAAYVSNAYYIVVADNVTLAHLHQREATSRNYSNDLNWKLAASFSGTDEEKREVIAAFRQQLKTEELTLNGTSYPLDWFASVRQDNIQEAYGLYGGFLFLGILLGLLFLMATVLIIYYKQIIEGYDDRSRFQIMRQVGMSKKLISSSVRSQVLTMFLLPLGVAAVHLCFAFPLLTRVLRALALDNVIIFFWCTLITFGAFVVVYVLVYLITARVYYHTVSIQERR